MHLFGLGVTGFRKNDFGDKRPLNSVKIVFDDTWNSESRPKNARGRIKGVINNFDNVVRASSHRRPTRMEIRREGSNAH